MLYLVFKIIIILFFCCSFFYVQYSFAVDKTNKMISLYLLCLIMIVTSCILLIDNNNQDKQNLKNYNSCKLKILNNSNKNKFVTKQLEIMYLKNQHCYDSYQNQVICEKIQIEINKTISQDCQRIFSKDIINVLMQDKINQLSILSESQFK